MFYANSIFHHPITLYLQKYDFWGIIIFYIFSFFSMSFTNAFNTAFQIVLYCMFSLLNEKYSKIRAHTLYV